MSCECSGCARCCAAKKPEWTVTDLTISETNSITANLKIECDPTDHDFSAISEYRALCRKCGQRIFL